MIQNESSAAAPSPSPHSSVPLPSEDLPALLHHVKAFDADRLTRQFSGMDARVAVLKATQSYLEQQVALWTNAN